MYDIIARFNTTKHTHLSRSCAFCALSSPALMFRKQQQTSKQHASLAAPRHLTGPTRTRALARIPCKCVIVSNETSSSVQIPSSAIAPLPRAPTWPALSVRAGRIAQQHTLRAPRWGRATMFLMEFLGRFTTRQQATTFNSVP